MAVFRGIPFAAPCPGCRPCISPKPPTTAVPGCGATSFGGGFGSWGASHGLDTLLLFGTTDVEGEVTAAGPTAVAEARLLSEVIRADHLAFAATGNPGWSRFRRRERRTRVYDPEPHLVGYPEERSRRIWRDRRFGGLDLRD